ncbi:MAG: hypothetical protein DME06_08840 [Candidatus Rokuibacteriota bacterium]|nr:MAG: hypothetical protein DME06_08840 [Candidatus Rokubacteria bacterium]
MALSALLQAGDRVRRGETPADDVILQEGEELDSAEVKRVLRAFSRIRWLERQIARPRQSTRVKRPSATARRNDARRIAAAREAIQTIVARMPLKPALIDQLVADVRRRCEPLERLSADVRQALSRALADQSRTIRIPVHIVEQLHRISRLNRTMVSELGRDPTPEELAQHSGVPAKKVRLILESSRKPLSLESPVGGDSELGDFLEDTSAGSPDDALLSQDLTTRVERALATLSPKEKEILRLRFGMGAEGERTLEEIGQRFAVTRERIRQIEVKALRKLRHPRTGRTLRALAER